MEKQKNKLFLEEHQIISIPLVEIKSEFEFLHKAIKVTSFFTGENLGHLIVANNAIYLCWGKLEEEFINEHGYLGFELKEDLNSFKKVANFITQLVDSKLSHVNLERDNYDKYSEFCYLGCKITTEFRDDANFEYSNYYKAFAKVVPAWLTLEK